MMIQSFRRNVPEWLLLVLAGKAVGAFLFLN